MEMLRALYAGNKLLQRVHIYSKCRTSSSLGRASDCGEQYTAFYDDLGTQYSSPSKRGAPEVYPATGRFLDPQSMLFQKMNHAAADC
jgi:hypothetical protein